MAYIKYGFFEPGSRVEVQSEEGTLDALIVELPFYRAVKVEP
jgi:hypothetical protein